MANKEKEKSVITKNNRYFSISYYCSDKEDARLRYPTGVKISDKISAADQKRMDEIKKAADNYIEKYLNVLMEPVLKAEITLYLDKKFNPDKLIRKTTNTFIADHKKMIDGMRAGEILKRDGGLYSK